MYRRYDIPIRWYIGFCSLLSTTTQYVQCIATCLFYHLKWMTSVIHRTLQTTRSSWTDHDHSFNYANTHNFDLSIWLFANEREVISTRFLCCLFFLFSVFIASKLEIDFYSFLLFLPNYSQWNFVLFRLSNGAEFAQFTGGHSKQLQLKEIVNRNCGRLAAAQ